LQRLDFRRRLRREDGWRRDAGGGEAAHDVGDVGAEDFDQFQDHREAGDVAAVLEDADVGRRDPGALREFLARPAALLARSCFRIAPKRAASGSIRIARGIRGW
jgi:hypothetical protein